MKKMIAAIAIVLAMLMFAPAQSAAAATTGNSVCVTTSSATGAWVDALYDGWRVAVYRGQCKYSVQGFSVPNGWYCTSQWGYVYNGDWFGRAYMFSTNNNSLRLTCRHA